MKETIVLQENLPQFTDKLDHLKLIGYTVSQVGMNTPCHRWKSK
jgi:hypothetical protein